jgi:RNA polymerase sigma-70 factor (ECF subfamily)
MSGVILEELWEAHRLELACYIANKVHNPDTVSDLVSTVYLRAWVAMCNGNGYKDNRRGWMYQIARSAIYDYWRERQYKTFIDFDSLFDEASEFDVHEQTERTIALEQVYAALERLPANQGDCMRLYLVGYGQNEIGKLLGTTPGGVKQLKIRAIVNLRECLSEAT